MADSTIAKLVCEWMQKHKRWPSSVGVDENEQQFAAFIEQRGGRAIVFACFFTENERKILSDLRLTPDKKLLQQGLHSLKKSKKGFDQACLLHVAFAHHSKEIDSFFLLSSNKALLECYAKLEWDENRGHATNYFIGLSV